MSSIEIKPQGVAGRVMDVVALFVMFLIYLARDESRQRTHFWNKRELTVKETKQLNENLMLSCEIDDTASSRFTTHSHIPVLRGRRSCVVGPANEYITWFPGWRASGRTWVSRIPSIGPMRMSGKDMCLGFDFDGQQIEIKQIEESASGAENPIRHFPSR